MKRLWAVVICLLLSGCGGGTDWDGFAPAQDARLVIYTSHEESVYAPIIQEFEERTGLWVQVEAGGTAALLERLEKESGAPVCDLMFGGGVDSLQAGRDLFAPYVSPMADALDPACRCPDGSWTGFSLLPVVLIYNPMLVRMNPPEGWGSLLDPAWRGRIAFKDPLASGASYTALAALLQTLPGEPLETLDAFYQNLNGLVVDYEGDVAVEVAEGRYTIGVALEEVALLAAEGRSDIALLYPEEGTVRLPDGMAVVKNAPHGDNARLFIDFCLGEDVQNYLVNTCRRRPARVDVDWFPAETEDLRLLDYDLDRAAREREAILDRWRRLREEAP